MIESKKIGSNGKIFGLLAICSILLISGCDDFFAEKPTVLQSRSILRDISKIEPVENPYRSIPYIYKTPPKIVEQIVGGGPEFKLFYFCKHHTSDKLEVIVNEQFATKLFNEKGKSSTVSDYTVNNNPATNQLIVRCPARADVEAVLELLEFVDIPPIQIKIDCLISEVYADVTMDWETTLEIQNLFGEQISLGGKIVDGVTLPAFPGAALRDAARATFGLKAGYVSGDNFSALVDLLISRGYLKILMNPTLEVVNGQTAEIHTSERVPLDQITTVTRDGFLVTQTEYVDVIDSLEITPHAFADGYIGLETKIVIGSKSTPEGVKQIPIVTTRQITNKENRIRHGESLLIGGITKTEERSVVRGVPFLKDIPILGVLFSSKDFEERGKEILFIITPTISSGGIPNEEMVDLIREKHKPPANYDMFDFDANNKEIQRKALITEEALLKAEIEREDAQQAVQEANEQTEKAQQQAEKAQQQTKKAQAETQKAKTETVSLKELLEKSKRNSKDNGTNR